MLGDTSPDLYMCEACNHCNQVGRRCSASRAFRKGPAYVTDATDALHNPRYCAIFGNKTLQDIMYACWSLTPACFGNTSRTAGPFTRDVLVKPGVLTLMQNHSTVVSELHLDCRAIDYIV